MECNGTANGQHNWGPEQVQYDENGNRVGATQQCTACPAITVC